MKNIFKKNKSRGFAAIIALLAVCGLVLILTFSLSASLLTKKQISKNLSNSLRSYYLAESGMEDAIVRVVKNYNYPTTPLVLDGASVEQVIPPPVGDTTTISVSSSYLNNVRKLTTSLTLSTTAVSFYYGVQVGAGGASMANNTTIVGNLYSDGPVIGGPAKSSKITGDVVVANGEILDKMIVKGTVKANTITDSKICGDAYYQSIDSGSFDFLYDPKSPTCSSPLTDGTGYVSPDEPSAPMPITADDIAGWKASAEAGGVYSDAAHCMPAGDIVMGPAKLDCQAFGGFSISNWKKLTMTGIIWVKGNITISNNGIVELDSGYGTNSGVMLADDPGNEITSGIINANNNAIVCGSEGYNSGSKTCNASNSSYLLLLSTHSGATVAIDVSNNVDGAIFYAANGIARITNNANVKEVTAYRLELSENTAVTYESGLASAAFSSGPGGGWLVNSWNETE